MSGVSAEWVNERFTSLRVSLPEGSIYRITYTSVNESSATEPKTVTTNSISHVVKDFRPDWFYSVMVEAVSLDSDEAVNGSIGIGEQFHIMLLEIVLKGLFMSNSDFCPLACRNRDCCCSCCGCSIYTIRTMLLLACQAS